MKKALAIALAVGSLSCVALSPAVAQERMMVTASIVDGGPAQGASGKIGKSSVEAYAKLLGLTEDQKNMAMGLHEGYDSAYTQAQKDFGSAMEEIRRASEESGDHSVFAERFPKAREDLSKKTKALEKSFMSDLQALLSTEQAGSWNRVERHRRRELLLRPGAVSGEGVNLIETVAALKLPSEVMATLAEPLAAYESDMDRALAAKQRVMDEQADFDPSKGFDPQAFQERMTKQREAGIQVRDVNQQYQRRIEDALPEERRPGFADAVKKAAYPSVFRPSRVARHLEAAGKFDDLSADQKEALSALRASYDRDVAAANEKIVSEIDAAESKGENGGQMALLGGGQMNVRFGDDNDNSPLNQARKAKRELDDRARSRLESILSKEQKERLPKEQETRRGGGQFIMDDAVIIGR